jgi:hypothetical protein
MAVDYIRYDILTQDALRGVVRTVLEDAAKNGLPGEHHFYISFDPRMDGVKLSQRMRAQYPEEMTIVLQHQFWDLTVSDDRFEVGLAFGGVSERVVVPFAAIKGFFDPSAQFGVQFEQFTQSETVGTGAEAQVEPAARPPVEQKNAAERSLPPVPANPPSELPSAGASDATAEGAEIVRLDRFRKK